jgi:hypothetical protein
VLRIGWYPSREERPSLGAARRVPADSGRGSQAESRPGCRSLRPPLPRPRLRIGPIGDLEPIYLEAAFSEVSPPSATDGALRAAVLDAGAASLVFADALTAPSGEPRVWVTHSFALQIYSGRQGL